MVDYQATGECDSLSSVANGEYARTYAPCASGFYNHNYALSTATLADGAHGISICDQDFGQFQGLNGTRGETCQARTIRVDNSPLAYQLDFRS